MRVVWIAAWIAAWIAIPAYGQEGQKEDEDIRKELEELRKEVKELREWKDSMDRRANQTGERQSPPQEAAKGIADDFEAPPPPREPRIELPRSLRLSISGENRSRFEYMSRVYSPANPDGRERFDFTHMRTRLRFDFEVEEDIDAIVELQDVRTWGDEGSTIADAEGVDLKRGVIVLRNLFDQPLSLEVGRFVLSYGDQRVIGALEWFDQGRTYDGFRMSYDWEEGYVDFFGTRIEDDATGDIDEQDLLGVYAGVDWLVGDVSGEAYTILYRDQERRMGENDLGSTQYFTFGTRLFGKTGPFDYTGEIAAQRGEVRDDDLTAWAFAVKGGYTVEEASWKPRFGVEVDYASGNDDPTDGDTETFQTLLPTNHLHYGYIDLVAWSNILAFRGSVEVRPAEKLLVTLDYHHFRLDDEEGGWMNAGGATIRPGANGASKDLGDEIDLQLTWDATDSLSLLAGWAHFFAGDFVSDTGNDTDADFLYLQAHLRF